MASPPPVPACDPLYLLATAIQTYLFLVEKGEKTGEEGVPAWLPGALTAFLHGTYNLMGHPGATA